MTLKEKQMEKTEFVLFRKRKAYDYVLYSAVILVGILLDQLTKWLAVKYLQPIETVSLIKLFGTEVLNLTYVENEGAAFGMLKDSPWVFNSMSTVMLTAMSAYLYLGHADSRLTEISLAMVISGGIGNMIDRASLKYVVDFIDFRLINFAVFNGADSFVCVGAALLFIAMLREIIKEEREKKAKKEENSQL